MHLIEQTWAVSFPSQLFEAGDFVIHKVVQLRQKDKWATHRIPEEDVCSDMDEDSADTRGKEVVQDHGDDQKARPRGKTYSKKEDRRDATSIALLEQVEGMISKKDLKEEKHRQEKEEQMHAFTEIQRRRLEMDAEKQTKMLELDEAKQAKMLKIEATNARTKAKEVALASLKTSAEIMKVDLNTVSSRKRL
ncbi:Helicase SKI2W [Hordeum vulgare]|nr:Helicase SKI2W [Hordeum vulgare]